MENENIEQIRQKLAFMNINKIVSIDNEWGQKNNISLNKDITDFIEEMHPKNEEQLLRKISNEGYLTIKDAIDANDEEFIELINQKTRIQNELPPNLKKLNDVLVMLQEKGISVEKIEKYNSNIFKKYNKENCLFILDKEMDEGNNKDIIKESIPSIIEEACGKGINHLIIVYSSNIGNEYKSNSKKLEYVEQRIGSITYKSNFYIYKMFAIEKRSETRLDEELNMKISDCIYGDALYHYMILEKEKTDNIYKSICKIENEEISRISEENIIEGNCIKDSINTIRKAIMKMQENEQLDKCRDILEKFNFYQKNKIQNFISSNVSLEKSGNYRRYREKQDIEFINNILKSDITVWENIDYSINKMYTDISTGDIFKIKLLQDKKEKYLLIVQNACDCVLRNKNNIKDISRKDREGNIKVLILEKYDISKMEQSKLVEQFNNGEIIFPVKEEEYYCLKNTGKIVSIPQILLDLCTLNEDGKCLLNYENQIIQKYKNYYFEKYMDKPETIESIKHLRTYLAIDDSKIKEILKFNEKNENIINSFEIQRETKENLWLKRIGRLDYNITLRLCQKNYYEIENQILTELGNEEAIEKLKKHRKSTNPSTEKFVSVKNINKNKKIL